jgi:hypothetical protein
VAVLRAAAEDTLASFDPVIETLNKFEEIRYPDEMGSTGMHCTFALGKATPIETNVQNSERSEPVYQLLDIDALVKAILDKCGLGPIAYYPPPRIVAGAGAGLRNGGTREHF